MAEDALHQANKDALSKGKIDCQNNCHRQGAGSQAASQLLSIEHGKILAAASSAGQHQSLQPKGLRLAGPLFDESLLQPDGLDDFTDQEAGGVNQMSVQIAMRARTGHGRHLGQRGIGFAQGGGGIATRSVANVHTYVEALQRALEAQFAPSHAAFLRTLDSGTPEIQALVAQVDRLLSALKAPEGSTAASFVNTHYVPFFLELRRKQYVEPFVYWASQRAPVPGVAEWLQANQSRVREFFDWASKYSWPAP